MYITSDEHHTKTMLFSVIPNSTLCLQITSQEEDSIRGMKRGVFLKKKVVEIYMRDLHIRQQDEAA